MEQYKNHLRQPLNLLLIFGCLLPYFIFIISLLVINFDYSIIVTKYRENGSVIKTKFLADLKPNYIHGFLLNGTLSEFKFIPFKFFLFHWTHDLSDFKFIH